MKQILILTLAVAISAATATANCGKKVTDEGNLKAFDAEKKLLTVEKADGKMATLTLTPTSKGAETTATLVGKKVKVTSEHGKIDSVEAAS